MPDIIKLLPDSVANQIAAGEVIQRPASLLKELVENSVDAGSTSIKIIIKDAGRTLVQVIDNGSGMSETDARLCFERHATSKIKTADDLFAISTKGFRGEALASIAAVAMVEVKTRKHDSETGTLIKISASKVELQEATSCQPGSNIAVKSLFFNVPARRKFLKTEATELRHLIIEFQRIALAHPDIKFSFISNEKDIFNLAAINTRQRIVGIFGKIINSSLITIKTETSLTSISGFIGKPEHARKTFGEQYFFINNRFMRHPYFHKAIMEAYEKILPADSIPSYFIYLEADPASIDVNIHPTKTEIKFENERAIWQIIHASVREGIGKFNISPSLDFDTKGLIDIPIANNSPADMPKIEIDTNFDPFRDDNEYRRNSISFDRESRSNPDNWEKLYSNLETDKKEQDNKYPHTDSRKLIQIRSKYIICPVKSGIMLINQKRAHERILFEEFIRALEDDTTVSQKTLFPQTMELDQSDIALLSEIEDDIKNCGFDIQYLGNNAISINGYPADSKNDDPQEMLEILLEEYKRTERDPGKNNKERIAICMSRAAAIPYGRPLEYEEITELVDKLFSCNNPNYSPTGKSVLNIITLDELDKRLK